MAYSAVTIAVACAQAHCDDDAPASAHHAVFDSDSYAILVDDGATVSITNNLNNFVTPPQKSNIRIKGFNGTSSNAKVGTVKWPIVDDNVVCHVLQTPNTNCVASCPMILLSPQHYSQQIKDHQGTYSTNYGDQVLFVTLGHKMMPASLVPRRYLQRYLTTLAWDSVGLLANRAHWCTAYAISG
jgi:hypothetical protein